MGILDNFFGQPSKNEEVTANFSGNDHCVIVHFIYYKDELDPLHDLERELERVIEDQGVGQYDGHEIALDMSDGFLYMYGPNAESLFKAVKPALENTDFTKGSLALLRFGGPGSGAKEIEIQIEK
jgi:hypothetical protein